MARSTAMLTGDIDSILAFMRKHMPLAVSQGMRAIGWVRGNELVAGVIYEGHNGRNVWMHVASSGANWLTRTFLRAAFEYPFSQLGVARVSVQVAASNKASRRFVEHLGFQLEATLTGASRDGGDALIYVMWKKDCRYG